MLVVTKNPGDHRQYMMDCQEIQTELIAAAEETDADPAKAPKQKTGKPMMGFAVLGLVVVVAVILAVVFVTNSKAVPKVVDGRPFRDHDGTSISPVPETDQTAAWSKPQNAEPHIPIEPRNKIATVGTTIPDHQQRQLAQEWTNRAIGEHASIASFAAFTISLMSNQAPPDFIQDSLSAAQDEVRHAKVSFKIAALLLGNTTTTTASSSVEPSVLPQSHHTFGNNLAALVLGVVREGCIEETLSAFQMAVEVDNTTDHDYPTASIEKLLMDTTRTIALDEGRHPALAWQTVR